MKNKNSAYADAAKIKEEFLNNREFFMKTLEYRDKLNNTLTDNEIEFDEYIKAIELVDITTSISIKKKIELFQSILFPQDEKELEILNTCLDNFIRIKGSIKSRTDFYENNTAKKVSELLLEGVTDKSKLDLAEQELIKVYSDSLSYGRYIVDLHEYINYPYKETFYSNCLEEAEKNKGIGALKFLTLRAFKSYKTVNKARKSAKTANPEMQKIMKGLESKKITEMYANVSALAVEYLNSLEENRAEGTYKKSLENKTVNGKK